MAEIEITDNFKKEEYNNFLLNNPYASVFQTLEMAEVYKRYTDTEPLILVAKNGNSGEIEAALLAKKIREKKGYLESLSLHSTIRGGPVFRDTKNGARAASLLLQNYDNMAKDWGPLYTRIYPLFDTPQLIPAYIENNYEYGGWNNYIINLKRPVEEIWKDLSESNKRNIKKTTKSEIYIEEVTEKSLIPDFYSLLAQNYASKGYPLEGIEYFQHVFDILIPKNMVKFFVAKYKEKYVAARLVLCYKGVISDWHVGALEEFLSLKPNNLLVWHILEWGVKNNYHTFDFGGGGEPGQFLEGWVEFKRSFGGKLVNYGRYTKVHQEKKMYVAKKGFQYYKKLKLIKNERSGGVVNKKFS